MSSSVRTRFAPSPTGSLHVGGIRTALFAWLAARHNGGQFILRIEDTDQARQVEGAEKQIIDSLHTLGLDYDEGPDIGGPFGPYRQSERLNLYKQRAQQLVDSGRAYVDPYSTEQVQAFRAEAAKAKRPFLYRDHRPDKTGSWDGSQPLRFKSDPKSYDWHDEVMGELHTGAEVIDDFVLMKSDGYPTYNFAHIIDDAEMKITHIIRGQEFIASVPNYLNLYEALDLKAPLMATMPHILGPDGKKKLSKRDGAKDVLEYVKVGFLPDALVNFIASLGWNDGTKQEIFSRQELIEKFSLNRVGRSGSLFDERRLLWTNGAYIRELPIDQLLKLATDFWPTEARQASDDYKKSLLGLIQERLKFLGELPDLTRFFFVDLPINPDLWQSNQNLQKLTNKELEKLLQISRDSLEQSDFTVNDLTDRLNKLLEKTVQKPAVLFSLLRIATTQAPASPGLADTMAVLGKTISLKRIDNMLSYLKQG